MKTICCFILHETLEIKFEGLNLPIRYVYTKSLKKEEASYGNTLGVLKMKMILNLLILLHAKFAKICTNIKIQYQI